MSLLKAVKFKTTSTTEELRQLFLAIIATSAGEFEREDLKYMVLTYCNLSAIYISEIAKTLQTPAGVQDTMKYMNSYIAEITTQLGLPYYHVEEGYTIIDKALQVVLDNGAYTTKADFIDDIIDELVEAKNKVDNVDVETEEA